MAYIPVNYIKPLLENCYTILTILLFRIIYWYFNRYRNHEWSLVDYNDFSCWCFIPLIHNFFLFFFHHVFFYVLYNIIRSDRVYWGSGWLGGSGGVTSWNLGRGHAPFRRIQISRRGAVRRRGRNSGGGRRRSVTLIVCRVLPSLRPYDRPTPRRYDVIRERCRVC